MVEEVVLKTTEAVKTFRSSSLLASAKITKEYYVYNDLTAAAALFDLSKNKGEAYTFDDVLLEPQYSEIESRKNIDLRVNITPLRQIDIPIVAANMDTVCDSKMAMAMRRLGGNGVIHRYMSYETQLEEIHKVSSEDGGTNIWITAAAVGVKNGVLGHIKNLVKEGCKIIVIDVAHGFHKVVGDLLIAAKALKLKAIDEKPVEYIAGNIATPEAANHLISCGADVLKIGVGPGSLCTTRIVTGHGMPQLTAIAACALAALNRPVTVMADGGIRNSGDIVKALAAGANTVMCGSIFAGTDEAPGDYMGGAGYGPKFKIYRGMASSEAQKDFYGNSTDAPEGTVKTINAKGPIEPIVKNIVAGVKSGLSYSGCNTIAELQAKASWVKITGAGLRESHPHLLYAND